MDAEIISVGTEIILGQITNTNARYLADQLRQLDIKSHWKTTVDDHPSRIIEAIKQAEKRAHLIFICGGLGPTDDDVTMSSVASALDTELELDQDYWVKLQNDFAKRQVDLAPENIRQAYYLKGGEPLSNPVGLALGSMITQGHHTFVVLPGPPREFKAMVSNSLIPKLRQLTNGRTIMSANLHFVGYPESSLMDDINHLLEPYPEIIATSYVQPDETQVRLTVYDLAEEHAQKIINKASSVIIEKLGQYYFGTGENITLAGEVLQRLASHHYTISAAESLTGGLFQATLCSVPGASRVFEGGFVTYATQMKTQLLGIPSEFIEQYGVVSGEVAGAMAKMSAEKTGANIGIGFTGVAGPDTLDGHQVGEVWVGIQYDGQLIKRQLHLSQKMGREAIRRQSVQLGLLMLLHLLLHKTE